MKANHKKQNEETGVGFAWFERPEEQEKIWEEKKEVCKKYAIPREKKVSGIELKHYLIKQQGAVEMQFPIRLKQMYKASLLYDLHPEIFPESCFPPREGGKKAFVKWAKQHNPKEIDEFARDIPDEKYGLEFSYLEITEKEVRIYIEMTTGRMQLSSTWYDTEELNREIVLWMGITKEDIENETDAFMIFADEYYHSFSS